MFFIYQLSVPRILDKSEIYGTLIEYSAKLICTTPEYDELAKEAGLQGYQEGVTGLAERVKLRAEIDGLVAHLYGLTEEEFAHILTTFPLVEESVKTAAMDAYKVLCS